MGNTNSHSKQRFSFRRSERHISSSSKNSSSIPTITATTRNQSPLTTVSSFNVHHQVSNNAISTPNNQEQQPPSDVVFAASHALVGIGAASSSHCSNNNQQQTPSSPVLLSSSMNTSFNVFPLHHVDSDMTSLTSTTTSVRNSRTALSTSIHISDIPTNINTVMQISNPTQSRASTTNNNTTIHTTTINNTTTISTTNESSNLKSRQSLPPSTQQQIARLQENSGYRRSLSTPKLSLLKKKNVLKAFFMLHRRNTIDEAEMKGEEEFGRRVTDSEEFISMQNVNTPIVDLSPSSSTQLPQHRPRVHSITSAATSDSSSSATRAGADTDTDTTIAAELDEKKKIANILNKSFSKTRTVIKTQSHSHVEIPSSDHGKTPSDRKNLERSASAPSIMTNELELLLRDAMGFQLFKDFCVAEFSVENLNCWQELLDMEKNFIDMSGKRRSKVINMVYDKFLDDGCSEEINIRGKTKKLVDTERKSGTINLDTSKHLLHEIKRDLYTNLVDSFSRFIYTDEYKLWHELKTNPSNVFE
ncbi:predicted protein [Naegleria gruberi]|uniref:Predicted protein n=1 Tax=Naegleria gruberi TaxID=5762 RepID=D2VSR8_NAEGR|nr:uncharacterized protein NAEGRDRAFT_51966 [Naegleria gruberi]EFC40242.1 predicted protein [Naegleria gruberi]|eukprot:XP_002672986.1 predicted protein [Naegleria gruberi strain NEG-M]